MPLLMGLAGSGSDSPRNAAHALEHPTQIGYRPPVINAMVSSMCSWFSRDTSQLCVQDLVGQGNIKLKKGWELIVTGTPQGFSSH